jgi:hypothetical protein
LAKACLMYSLFTSHSGYCVENQTQQECWFI